MRSIDTSSGTIWRHKHRVCSMIREEKGPYERKIMEETKQKTVKRWCEIRSKTWQARREHSMKKYYFTRILLNASNSVSWGILYSNYFLCVINLNFLHWIYFFLWVKVKYSVVKLLTVEAPAIYYLVALCPLTLLYLMLVQTAGHGGRAPKLLSTLGLFYK